MRPKPNKQDLEFLRECTQDSSYEEKAQIWKHYQAEWVKGMEAAEKSGEPEYRLQNAGRFRANSLLRERIALRREMR